MTNDDFIKIAEKLKVLGAKYYDKDEIDKTAIFWELEAIFREVGKVDSASKKEVP